MVVRSSEATTNSRIDVTNASTEGQCGTPFAVRVDQETTAMAIPTLRQGRLKRHTGPTYHRTKRRRLRLSSLHAREASDL